MIARAVVVLPHPGLPRECQDLAPAQLEVDAVDGPRDGGLLAAEPGDDAHADPRT